MRKRNCRGGGPFSRIVALAANSRLGVKFMFYSGLGKSTAFFGGDGCRTAPSGFAV
jgi:hypothetical protein